MTDLILWIFLLPGFLWSQIRDSFGVVYLSSGWRKTIEVLVWTGPGKTGGTVYFNQRDLDKGVRRLEFHSHLRPSLNSSTRAGVDCSGTFPYHYQMREFVRGSQLCSNSLITLCEGFSSSDCRKKDVLESTLLCKTPQAFPPAYSLHHVITFPVNPTGQTASRQGSR